MISMRQNIPSLFTVAILACFMLCHVAPAIAEEGKIIKIDAVKNDTSATLTIDPAELAIEKDVIVIWLNSIVDQEVNVLFQHKELPAAAVTDSMGFGPDKNGAYAAKYLPFIATASLRFIETGTYSYTVEMKNGTCAARGTIIVDSPTGP
jgi:hypothetical protein